MSTIVNIKFDRRSINTSLIWDCHNLQEVFELPISKDKRKNCGLIDDFSGFECDPAMGTGAGPLVVRDNGHPDPPLCCHRVALPLVDPPLIRLETEIAIRLYGCKAILVDEATLFAADHSRFGHDLAFVMALGRQYGIPVLRVGSAPGWPPVRLDRQDCPNSAFPPWAADH